MAQVDTNFYSTIQGPDIAGGIQQGLKMSQLATQNKIQGQELADKQAVRDAYKGNMTQDEGGNMVLNKQGYLSALSKVNPQLAFEHQKALAQNERDTQAAQIQSAKDHMSLIGQKLNGITDQASYDSAKADALKNGWVKPGELPDAFDPNHIKQLQAQTMDAHSYLDQQMKERGLVNDETKTGIEGLKAKNEHGDKQAQLKFEYEKEFGRDQGPAAPVSPDTDPATLVRSKVPKVHQQKAFDQIESAQNTASNSAAILKAFDNASNNFHGADLIPGMLNADQKQMHALMGPTFKDVEGTVRQAAMDNAFANMTPQFGDSEDTKAKKRAALVGYLNSKQSSPDTKGYGIDLKNFKSTTMQDPAAKTESQIAGSPQQQSTASYAPDILSYAQTHNITPDQAAAVKAQRTSAVGKR